MVVEKRATTWNYLVNGYSYMVDESKVSHTTPTAGASSESSVAYTGRGYINMNNGTWAVSGTPYKAYWTDYYQGIREATFFMQNVDRCPEITELEKELWKNEARFLRAYTYSNLMRLDATVILLYDELIDFNEPDLDRERATRSEEG